MHAGLRGLYIDALTVAPEDRKFSVTMYPTFRMIVLKVKGETKSIVALKL